MYADVSLLRDVILKTYTPTPTPTPTPTHTHAHTHTHTHTHTLTIDEMDVSINDLSQVWNERKKGVPRRLLSVKHVRNPVYIGGKDTDSNNNTQTHTNNNNDKNNKMNKNKIKNKNKMKQSKSKKTSTGTSTGKRSSSSSSSSSTSSGTATNKKNKRKKPDGRKNRAKMPVSLPQGWRVFEKVRQVGKKKGTTYRVYVDPQGKRYRSYRQAQTAAQALSATHKSLLDPATNDSMEATINGTDDFDGRKNRAKMPVSLPQGWRVFEKVRQVGKKKGTTYRVYVDPQGKRYRSYRQAQTAAQALSATHKSLLDPATNDSMEATINGTDGTKGDCSINSSSLSAVNVEKQSTIDSFFTNTKKNATNATNATNETSLILNYTKLKKPKPKPNDWKDIDMKEDEDEDEDEDTNGTNSLLNVMNG